MSYSEDFDDREPGDERLIFHLPLLDLCLRGLSRRIFYSERLPYPFRTV